MTTMLRIITAAAISLGLLAGITGTSVAASASTRPVVYMAAGQVYHWTMPRVQPGVIYLGFISPHSYGLHGMHWSHWTNTAYGRGTLIVGAGSAGPVVKYLAGITLEHVKTHRGIRYFATMKLSYYANGHHHVLWLVMTSGGWWRLFRHQAAPLRR